MEHKSERYSVTLTPPSVRAIDQELKVLEAEEKAVSSMDEYLDLASRTARDDIAVQEMQELSERTREIRASIDRMMCAAQEEAMTVLALEKSR